MEYVTMEAVGIATAEWIALLEVGDAAKSEGHRVVNSLFSQLFHAKLCWLVRRDPNC